MALTLRRNLDRRLTIDEMDDNFIYLEGLTGITIGYTMSKSSIDNLINNDLLQLGVFYKISGVDVNKYGGTDIILQAVSSNQLSPNGLGIFNNPLYNIGLAQSLNGGYGIWDPNATYATYSIGTDVIWGGKYWTNLTGVTGSSIDLYTLDSTNWSPIAFTQSAYYTESVDPIFYDYGNDMITSREEMSSGCLVKFTYESLLYLQEYYESGIDPIKAFQWGNPYNYDNGLGIGSQKIIDSYNENINFIGAYQTDFDFSQYSAQYYVQYRLGCYQSGINLSGVSYQGYIYLGTYSSQEGLVFSDSSGQWIMDMSGFQSYQEGIYLSNGSYQEEFVFQAYSSQYNILLDDSYQVGVDLDSESYQTNFNFNNSYQESIELFASYQNNIEIYNNSHQTSFSLTGSYQESISLNNNSYQNNFSLTSSNSSYVTLNKSNIYNFGGNMNNCNIEDINIDLGYSSAQYTNSQYTPYSSTFEYTIDDTFLVSSGLSSSITFYDISIPSSLSHIGRFVTNFNSGYSITRIIGTNPGLRVRFTPTNNGFNLYTLPDGYLEDMSNTVLLSSIGYGGLDPILDTNVNLYYYPINNSSVSNISSYIELELITTDHEVSINQVFNYGGHTQSIFIASGTGSNAFESDTWDNWNTKYLAGTLPIETYVWITDADNTDMGIVMRTNAFGNGFDTQANAIGYYLNADFQFVGDYSDINLVTEGSLGTLQGVWGTSSESGYSDNDICIWNCQHYILLNSGVINGSSPNNNTDAYVLLPKSDQINNGWNLGYILSADKVEYVFNDKDGDVNFVSFRYDVRGNKVSGQSFDTFQFGDDGILCCQQETYYCQLNTLNNKGQIRGGIQIGESSYIDVNGNSGDIYFSTNGHSSYFYAPGNTNFISCTIDGDDSTLESQDNSGSLILNISEGSEVYAPNNNGNIEYIKVSLGSYLQSLSNNGSIQYCEFKGGGAYVISLTASYSHTGNIYSIYDEFSFPATQSFVNCVLYPFESTFYATIDITGSSNISFNQNFDTGWAGIFTLTSANSNENISSISNRNSTIPFSVSPYNGLVVNVESTLVNSYSSGGIYLEGNSNVKLVGRAQSIISDFLNFTTDGSIARQISGSVMSINTPPVVTTESFSLPLGWEPIGTIVVSIDSSGGLPILDSGMVWGLDSYPTLSDNSVSSGATSIGTFTMSGINFDTFSTVYARGYATNVDGTSYGMPLSVTAEICLVKGTKVLLADLTSKNIEDIEYSDLLRVWNFDEGKFDTTYPLWIKRPDIGKSYNLLKFSDGSELRTLTSLLGHRIYNKEKGMFTYPMTDDTPIGTTTFNSNGDEVKLVSREILTEDVEYYNIMTDCHINLFANGILTSCRYNNMYPIKDMKFVKSGIKHRSRDEFVGIPDKYIDGFRLCEQSFKLSDITSYIKGKIEREIEFFDSVI